MPSTPELNRVSAIVLRFMRTPLLLLIAVYGIGVTGMALMPGQDAGGNPSRMNLFHAFYFFTYTATTTGFGEIPHQFSDAQRLWATVCLFMGVVAWLYAIGSIIRLAQHPEFLKAMAERRFVRSVRRIDQPFFVVCGFGDTGSLLARGLSDYFCVAAVIDIDTAKLPGAGEVDSWDGPTYAAALRHDPNCETYNRHFRQLLHVAFKIAAKMGDHYLNALKENEETVAHHVCENLFERHIKRLFLT